MGYQITLLYGYADSNYGMMHTFKVLDSEEKVTDEMIDELADNIELTSDDDQFDWDRMTLELPESLVKRIKEESATGGTWKLNKDGSGTCDQCHFTQKGVWDFDGWQNFCGVCGADMRERKAGE